MSERWKGKKRATQTTRKEGRLNKPYPKGLDPYRDLFGPKKMKDIAKVLREPESSKLGALRGDLQDVAASYVYAAVTTPLNVPYGPTDVSLSKRATWLNTNVINPCTKLLNALSDDNQPMFSDWPDKIDEKQLPDLTNLANDLDDLLNWCRQLRDDLEDRTAIKGGHSTEFRYDLVAALTDVYLKHFPNRRFSRGVYDKHLRSMTGEFPEFIRLSASEVLQRFENLDKAIEQIIKMNRI